MTITDQRLIPTYEAFTAGHQKILSLDIFDTLLWRRVPEPSDVFLLLGQKLVNAGRLAPHISPVTFAELRRFAQTSARERAFGVTGSREVTLVDIYAELPDVIFSDRFSANERVVTELECERDLMVLDQGIVALMEHAKGAGAKVVLVSDTYFSSESVNEFLAAAGFQNQDLVDRLFVSCEMGCPKFLDLFDFVLKELNVQASDLVHIGDSPVADIHPCESRGIPSVHYDKWSFSPRAQNKECPADRPDRLAFLGDVGDRGLTGLRSRIYHRTPQNIDGSLQPYWRYGASVLAPVFAGFTRWIVQSCDAAGAKRIFGIMREGRFLNCAVDATAKKFGVDIKTEELWLSRRAVIRAALFEDDLTLLPEAVSLSPGTTKDEVLAGLGLGEAEVDALFSAPFKLSGSNAVSALTQEILQTPALRTKILGHSALLRRNLITGLSKQIDLSQTVDIFVMDLGYAATIQTVLARILARAGARVRLRGLYLALNVKAAGNIASGADIRVYLDHEGIDGPTGALLSRTPDVLEHACMCREGSLSEYDAEGASVMLPNQRDDAQLLQMEAVQRGVLGGLDSVNDLLGDLMSAPTRDVYLKKQISGIINASLLYPTREEAKTIGAWYHEANFDLSDRRRLSDLAIDTAALEYQGWPALQAVGRGQCYWPAAALTLINPFAADVFSAGAEQRYKADHLTSGPMLGGLSICPDVGVGYDSKLEGTVPLTVNAFGRSEIAVALKPLGPQVYQRLRLRFPKASALLAIDQISLIYVGERDQKTIILDRASGLERITWLNMQSGPEKLLVTSKNGAEARVDLGPYTPAWLHALHVRIRYRYLKADSPFG